MVTLAKVPAQADASRTARQRGGEGLWGNFALHISQMAQAQLSRLPKICASLIIGALTGLEF